MIARRWREMRASWAALSPAWRQFRQTWRECRVQIGDDTFRWVIRTSLGLISFGFTIGYFVRTMLLWVVGF